MKVLITGGCGLIGYHTSMYYLNQGHEVDVLDNLERSSLLGHTVSTERANFNRNLLVQSGINVIHGDVSDEHEYRFKEGHDLIVHLAGQCSVPNSIINPRRDFEVNVLGTFNVLEYARKCGATVVFASTNKVYPIHDTFVKRGDRWEFSNPVWFSRGVPTSADSLRGSRTPYGWSKYSADLLCQEYAHTYGVRTGVFRMSCIYGTNQFGFEEQGWAAWFTIATEKGLPITIFGDGCQVRDMLYVEDCVAAYDAFYTSDESHGVYNLGGGGKNTLSLNECLDNLEKITGKRSKLTFEDWRPSDQKTYITNIEPTKIALEWAPVISPEEGLQKIYDWVKVNKDVF